MIGRVVGYVAASIMVWCLARQLRTDWKTLRRDVWAIKTARRLDGMKDDDNGRGL